MPRPHFPVRGGAHAQPRHAIANAVEAEGDCPGCKEKNAELARLRQELSRVTRRGGNGGGSLLAGPGMIWVALGMCGVGLLFALTAIFRHG